MILKDTLLPEFDHEMAVTRRVLERVPEPTLNWSPHPKSFSLGGLATHLAQIPHWGTAILTRDDHDLLSGGPRAQPLPTVHAILDLFDRHVAEVRRALVDMPDGQLLQPWTLRRGDHVVLSMLKIVAVRSFVVHHAIHHRGQLTVYLRLNDIPLPPIYGPSADESM